MFAVIFIKLIDIITEKLYNFIVYGFCGLTHFLV